MKDETVLPEHQISSRVVEDCFNFTGRVIRTYDHNGLCCVHKPLTSLPDEKDFIGCFVMRRRIEVHSDTQIISSIDEEESDSYLESIVMSIGTRKRGNRNVVTHNFKVPYKQLLEHDGSVYVKATDLVITTNDIQGEIIHPNSKAYLNAKIEQLYDSSHTYNVEINDPDATTDYFISLNNHVYTIKPTKTIWDGPYCKITFKPPNEATQTIAITDLDEDRLKEIGIFKSYRDADNYGKRLELQIKELENDTLISKAKADNTMVKNKLTIDDHQTLNKLTELSSKLENLQAEQESDRISHKRELENYEREKEKMRRDLEYEREHHRRKLDDLAAKDYYERRSLERKDSSELVKFIPVIVGAGLAAFALFK